MFKYRQKEPQNIVFSWYPHLKSCSEPPPEALVYASDNLSALFFSERSAADAPSAFDKTDWSGHPTVPDAARHRWNPPWSHRDLGTEVDRLNFISDRLDRSRFSE
jgi:hypothetical protein